MNESSSPAPVPVSPLWTRDFTIITLGSVISMLGNSMSGFALSLLVLDYTGSNLLYAIYIATFTLPQIVMPIFSGAILDRFSRKKTIYTLDFLSSGVYLVAALILSRGWFSFPMLALFCFIIGSINSIYYVAYDSFYPLLISEGNYSKAYSIASVLETLSALIIPIATYFYNLFGIAPLLGINALCFFIAATAETQIRAEEHYIEKQRAALALEEQHSSGRQLLRDIKEGFRYLMSEKGLLRVAIYFTFSMLASGASQVITLPYFKSTFDNGEYIYMLVWGMAIFDRAIGGAVRALGYDEIITYSFISPTYYDKIRMPKDSSLRNSLKILNPLGEDTSIMRTTILPSMLEIIARNHSYRNKSARLYELGKIYLPREDGLADEPKYLSLGAYGDGVDFFSFKGSIETLLHELRITDVKYVACTDNDSYHPGRCAKVYAGETYLGVFGQIHPLVAANYGMDTEVYTAELSFDAMYEKRGDIPVYQPLPKFPAVTRDIAVVCDEAVTVGALEESIRRGAKGLLKDVSLFDIYRGSGVAIGKKSVAFNLVLRADDRSLTGEEADEDVQSILAALKADHNAVLR